MTYLKCIITGCDLVDPDTDVIYHGDLFEMSDSYIFNATTNKGEAVPMERKQAVYIEAQLTTDKYFERRGVFVLPKDITTLSCSAQEYINKWK